MRPARYANARRQPGASAKTKQGTSGNPSTIEPFAIVIIAGDERTTTWGRYRTHAAADDIARRLRAHSIDARVIDERGAAP